jgi:hypothetical protein
VLLAGCDAVELLALGAAVVDVGLEFVACVVMVA